MTSKSKYTIEIANQQTRHPIPRKTFRSAVHAVLGGEGIRQATISLAVVDDPTIHRLNRHYLQHDYPTDVLSFILDRDGAQLDGEIIISADTAARECGEFGWTADEEMTLYVIHGLLHLVGWDDHSPADRRRMRAKEEQYLACLEITPSSRSGRSRSPRRKRK